MTANLNKREKAAVANAIARLMMLARHSLSPTQTRVATQSAEELLWLLGVEKIEREGRTYTAREPQGETIDLSAAPVAIGKTQR